MNTRLEITPEQEEEIVRQSLLNSMSVLENSGTDLDVSMYDALSEAVTFYSTPQQLREMDNRNIPKRWNEIVVNARA
jgi:hypothetical protein